MPTIDKTATKSKSKSKVTKANTKEEKAPREKKADRPDHEVIAGREKEVCKKYPNAVKGTMKRDTHGSHAGKLTIEVKCQEKGCKNTRRVGLSDVFQVKTCEEHRKPKKSKKD